MNSGRKTRLERIQQLSCASHRISACSSSLFVLRQLEAKPALALDHFGADVAGHDDDGVAEVHLAALASERWPSSMICRSILWASGWAFSTSSKTTIE